MTFLYDCMVGMTALFQFRQSQCGVAGSAVKQMLSVFFFTMNMLGAGQRQLKMGHQTAHASALCSVNSEKSYVQILPVDSLHWFYISHAHMPDIPRIVNCNKQVVLFRVK